MMLRVARLFSSKAAHAHGHGHDPALRVAVVLSGCGVYDGAEIHEATHVLLHLSRHGTHTDIYAPDIPQHHVVNHLTGKEDHGPARNVLVESARIARGKIKPLSSLRSSNHDALIFPGGFGAAKNLSSYALAGAGMKVEQEVARVVGEFHASKKPIGLCCIAPVIAAKLIKGCEFTIGSTKDDSTIALAEKLGAHHVVTPVTKAHVDGVHRIVTTPAFMCDAELHEIFDGIGEMVKGVLRLCAKHH